MGIRRSGRDKLRRHPAILITVFVTTVAGCTSGGAPTTQVGAPDPPTTLTTTSVPTTTGAAPDTTTTTPTTTTLEPVAAVEEVPAQDLGPLAGLIWPAGSITPGDFLWDNGEQLVTVDLAGNQTLLLEHPSVYPSAVAAAPDGTQVAVAVSLSVESGEDLSSVLYLLNNDGDVEVIDVAYEYHTLESPIFLRSPTQPEEPPRLHWIELNDSVSFETGRVDTRVMMHDNDGNHPVTVPLRYEEAVFRLTGYPGTPWFGITLYRTNDVPTRLIELLNKDIHLHTTDASPTLWADNEFRANTDIFVGTAWPDPYTYIIPVAHEFFPDDYSLRLFQLGCAYLGSAVVYRGTEIDWGFSEAPWPLLPTGDGGLLVLGAEDTQEYLDAYEQDRLIPIPWQRLDLATGQLSPTALEWNQAAWAWVAPAVDAEKLLSQPACSDHEWVYP